MEIHPPGGGRCLGSSTRGCRTGEISFLSIMKATQIWSAKIRKYILMLNALLEIKEMSRVHCTVYLDINNKNVGHEIYCVHSLFSLPFLHLVLEIRKDGS